MFASLLFPFRHFNLKTLNVTDHCGGHVTNISTLNKSHIVKFTELKLFFFFNMFIDNHIK